MRSKDAGGGTDEEGGRGLSHFQQLFEVVVDCKYLYGVAPHITGHNFGKQNEMFCVVTVKPLDYVITKLTDRNLFS